MAEDKRILKIFLTNGVVLQIGTRMPSAEIHKELEELWPNGLAHIDGEDDAGNHNVTTFVRSLIAGFVTVRESKVSLIPSGSHLRQ